MKEPKNPEVLIDNALVEKAPNYNGALATLVTVFFLSLIHI